MASTGAPPPPPPLDDDDDWFSKDIDDFVVDIKKDSSAEPGADVDTAASLLLESLRTNPKQFFDDVGGNYFDPFVAAQSAASTSETKFHLPEDRNGYVQKIPYSKLLNLSENESREVLLDIYSQREQFVKTFSQEKCGDELMLVTMKIMNKIASLPVFEINEELFLALVKEKNFWNNLIMFFKRSTNQAEARKKKNKGKIQGVSVMDMLLAVGKVVGNVRRILGEKKRIAKFLEELTAVLAKASVKSDALSLGGSVPSSSVKHWSIYPTLDDLKGPRADLKPNIVSGKFPSVDHYLEVHLNLLKEDFLIPLREGIAAYVAHSKSGSDMPFYGDNIRVHGCVKLLLPGNVNRRSAKEELVIVDLDPIDRSINGGGKSMRFSKWGLANSKRLMHGSMVCFSSGLQFDDLIVAIISHRDGEQLSNGYICVEIIKVENMNDIFDRELLMIESEIFFEPYHHVFNVVKNLKPDTFPLKSYIVDSQSQHQYPDYISRDRRAMFSHKGQLYNVKVPSEWPETGSPIGLNPSQYKAFKLALTHKFALIQGPPGTGKTFIGQEIVQALLSNTEHQILLICLTNHALDQFLSGVLRYSNSIVRMGSQSKHALLDSYNVKQLNEDVLIDKRLRTCYYNSKQEYLKQMEEFEKLQKEGSSEEIVQCLNCLQQSSRRIHELNQLSNYEFVKNIRVVGMTTTFAARNHTLLQLLKSPIVLIEEAAEVLESHIVASLTPWTEHCILIGDHYQLRPTTSVYALAQRYQMDISLFERMIKNQVNVVCLEEQHRMRPEFADLIRPTIYRTLLDADSVRGRPKVKGMRKNMFFFTHTVPEDVAGRDDEKSKKNSYECKFVLGLGEYLVAQGYRPEDIVILTAYNGQMLQLVQERKGHEKLHGIRITVVDNYQGEEAKIILLSLVRSNDSNSIGFLAFRNRICVALSRARNGLYMVGNMDLLAGCSKIWQSIKQRLEEHSAIGDTLELMCEEHMNIIKINHPDEFEKVGFGGCQDMCRVVKECGHQCDSFCHGSMYPHRTCLCYQEEVAGYY